MSINSLLDNPEILSALETVINDQLPPQQPGITNLINNDNNLNLLVIGNAGYVDLNDNLDVTTSITCQEVNTGKIYNNNQVYLHNFGSSSITTNNKISLSCNGHIVELDENSNLNFNNATLVTNSMNNIFSTDGTVGQVIKTDGNNNLSWVNQPTFDYVNAQKYIFWTKKQQISTQSGNPLELFKQTIPNFTLNKKIKVEIDFTFFIVSNISSDYTINITIDGNLLTVPTFAVLPLSHSFRSVIVDYTNSNTIQEVIVSISSQSTTFYCDDSDYLTILISEIQ